ncbi:MAG TPA: hypothetical protein VGO89_09460, partial [Streptomyces sp.]|nr:hypothetical protein [Streptomyces sp.]
MPLFTSFRQLLPNQRKAASDEGVTPDQATADPKDTAAGDGTSDREEKAAGAPGGTDPDKAVAGRSRRKDWRKKHPAAAVA